MSQEQQASDHALIAWAMCNRGGAWLAWGEDGRGEFVFYGLRYATRLDAFGVPAMTEALRASILAAKERWA